MASVFSTVLRCLTAFAFLAASMADNASAAPLGYKAPISMPYGGSQPPVCRVSDTLPATAIKFVADANIRSQTFTAFSIPDEQIVDGVTEIGVGGTPGLTAPKDEVAPYQVLAQASGQGADDPPADPQQKAMQDYQSGKGSVPVQFTNTTGDPVTVVATDQDNNGFPLYDVAAGEAIKHRAQPGTTLWFYKAGTSEIVGSPYIVEQSDGEVVSIPVAAKAVLSPMQQKQSGSGSVGARFTNATDDNVTVVVADENNDGHILFEIQRGASLDARVLPGAKLFFYKSGTAEQAAQGYEVAGLDGEEILISGGAPEPQGAEQVPPQSQIQQIQSGPGSIPVRFTNSLPEAVTVIVLSEGQAHLFFEIGAGETASQRVLPQTDLRFINLTTKNDIGEPYITQGVKGEKVKIVPVKPAVDPAVAALRDKQAGPGSIDIQFQNEVGADVAVTVKGDANQAFPLFTIPSGQIVTQKALPGSELWFYNVSTGEAIPPGYKVTAEQPQTATIRTPATLADVMAQMAGPGSFFVEFQNVADFPIEAIVLAPVHQTPMRLFQVPPGATLNQRLLPKTELWFVRAGTDEDVPATYVAPDTAPSQPVRLPYVPLNELAAAEAGAGSVPVTFNNRSGNIVSVTKTVRTGEGQDKKEELRTLFKIDAGQVVTQMLQPKTQIWFVKGDTSEPVGKDIPYYVRAIAGEAVQLPYNPTDDELLAMNGINIDKMIVELSGDFSQKTPEGPEFCWRDSYGRGAGTVPRTCPPGWSEDTAGLCYPNCKPGYKQFVTMCVPECPAGFRDDGLFCFKPAPYERNAFPWKFGDSLNMNDALARCKASAAGRRDGCGIYNTNTMVYTHCRRGFKTAPILTNLCSPECPSNTVEFGASCLKVTYDRGAGQLMSCSSGMQRDAGLCYNGCSNGFTGVGPVCWNQCPAKLPHGCGMGCARDKASCDSAITQQVTSPLIAAGSIALTIVTAGGGSAAANAAKTAGKTGAQLAAKATARETARQSIKASVKAALVRMAKAPLAKEVAIDTVIGATIGTMFYGHQGITADFGYLKLRDALKEIVRSRMIAKVDDDQIDAVVNTVMEGAEAKAGVDVDFPWTSLDPTGIADIVISYNYRKCSELTP